VSSTRIAKNWWLGSGSKSELLSFFMSHRSSISTVLVSDTNFGTMVRGLFFVGVMVVALGLALAFRIFCSPGVEVRSLLAVFFIAGLPMLGGLILSEVPRGTDWLMVRLGLATFCRTGLPLLIVLLVSHLTGVVFTDSLVGFLVGFYFLGFLTSVWISVRRFSAAGVAGSAVSVVEVDRAVV
jgi:hypothetical protein